MGSVHRHILSISHVNIQYYCGNFYNEHPVCRSGAIRIINYKPSHLDLEKNSLAKEDGWTQMIYGSTRARIGGQG
jgi:hypothetical protein